MITCSCMLVRAIVIREIAFICYYSFLILSNLLQLYLIWRYRDGRDSKAKSDRLS